MSQSLTEGVTQGSPEWFEMRLGKVSASHISDIMAKGKSGQPSATRANYMARLVCERLSGAPYPAFSSKAMERGVEVEAAARAYYEAHTGTILTTMAWAPHPYIEMSGASPDALIAHDGLAEFKCPHSATHIETLRGEKIDREYRLQMQWQMACTARQWCDFVSFDDRLPEGLRIKIIRVERDEMLLAEITREVERFLRELDELEAELRGMQE